MKTDRDILPGVKPQNEGDILPGRHRAKPNKTTGTRSARSRDLRKARRAKSARLLFAATAAVVAVTAIAALMKGIEVIRKPDEPAPIKKGPVQTAWLMFGTVESDVGGPANWLSVVSIDPKGEAGIMLYIPSTTYVEIPGHGLETIGKSVTLGREPLLLSATSNLLGVKFDHYIKVSDQTFRSIVEQVGGVDVHVDQKLTRPADGGKVNVIFAEGEQHMNGERAAEYLLYTNENGEEISRSVRHSVLWGEILEKLKGNKSALTQIFGEGGPVVSDAKPSAVRDLFKRLSSLPPEAVPFITLPVKQTGVGSGQQLYAPERERLEELVQKYLAAARPAGAGDAGRRIEILNGNGRPGIGQQVSADLVPHGFRVILNQNANSFDYERTQIVVYSDSKRSLEVGEEIKQLLGVGEIIVSRLSQSIVDVTIVVGKDYLEKKKG